MNRLAAEETLPRDQGSGQEHLILLVIPELLAPSMALALRAAFGVRVCNPANAVA
ncbi:MAG TPA: hypothetical protein VFP92_06420 [Rhodanobacteraceae bacterium]|nr:hypothetical protein [Rhodanobacteraceae bacterium]